MVLHTGLILLLSCTSLAKPIARGQIPPRQFNNHSLPGITETSITDETTSTITTLSPAITCVATVDVTPGDACSDIANPYGIQLSAFEASNPADSTACRNLLAGYMICVEESSISALSTTSPVSDATLPAPDSTTEPSPPPTSLSTWSSTGVTELTYTIGTGTSTAVRTITITRTSTEVLTLTTTMNVTIAATPALNSSYSVGNASTIAAIGTPAFASAASSAHTLSAPSVLTSPLFPSSTSTSSSWTAGMSSPSTPSSSTMSYTSSISSTSVQESTSQSISGSTFSYETLTSALTSSSLTSALTSSSSSLALTSSLTSVLTSSSQTSTLTSISTSSSTYTTASVTSSASVATATASGVDVYKMYSGDGSVAAGWPAQSQWVDFEYMFTSNTPNILASCAQWGVPENSATELANLKTAIQTVASASSVDPRFILAIIMQESTGCVRVITTAYSVFNPGLMQSHNGTGSCNTNNAPLGIPGVVDTGVVQTPCPYEEIQQQVQDGTQGTSSGDGLQQCWEKQGHTDVSGWYRAARMYNGGSIDDSGDLGKGCCTACYASDVANRLTGWVDAPHGCTL